jgi:hypothetical protein
LPGGLSSGGSLGLPGLAGGISGGSIGIYIGALVATLDPNGPRATMFLRQKEERPQGRSSWFRCERYQAYG